MEARLSLRLQYLPCCASTVSGMCLTASTVTVTSWMLQIKPSPSLLQGSKVELHPLAHAQFATFNSVQRLSPKKGASDKNSPPGEPGNKATWRYDKTDSHTNPLSN